MTLDAETLAQLAASAKALELEDWEYIYQLDIDFDPRAQLAAIRNLLKRNELAEQDLAAEIRSVEQRARDVCGLWSQLVENECVDLYYDSSYQDATRVEQTLRERCVELPASFWRLSALLALLIADLWEDCVSDVDQAAQGVDTEAIPPGYPLFSESSALRQHLQQAEDAATSAGSKLPDSVFRLAAVSALSVARRAEAWWSQLAQPRYDSSSGGDTDMAIEVRGRNPSSLAGEYFGANIWAWGAIHHLIIQLCKGLLDAETLEGIDCNEGYGPADQKTCTNMASRFELWMEHNVDGLCVELGWVSDMYGRLYKEEQVKAIPGLGMRPAHRVSDEFLKQWIEFLRHCGGFEVR